MTLNYKSNFKKLHITCIIVLFELLKMINKR